MSQTFHQIFDLVGKGYDLGHEHDQLQAISLHIGALYHPHQNHKFLSLTVSVISISGSISSDNCEVPVVLLASDDQLGELLYGDAPVGDLQLLNIVAASQYPLHCAHAQGDPEQSQS